MSTNSIDHYGSGADTLDLMLSIGVDELAAFCRGNVIKYVQRAGKKRGQPEESDLEKAAFYLRLMAACMYWRDSQGGKPFSGSAKELLAVYNDRNSY